MWLRNLYIRLMVYEAIPAAVVDFDAVLLMLDFFVSCSCIDLILFRRIK